MVNLSAIRDEELAETVDLAEFDFSRTIGRDAVLVSSGLTALEIALQSAGVKHGDWVACDGAYPFAGLAIRNVGGVPLFVDLDPRRDRLAVGPDGLLRLRADGVRVAVFTAYYGDIWSYHEARDRWSSSGGLTVEDRAQALEPVESSNTGWVTYSFQSNKLLSCGQGGAVVPPPHALGGCRRLRALGWWPRTSDSGSHWSSGWKDREQGRSARLAPIAALLLSERLQKLKDMRASLRRSAREALGILADYEAEVLGRVPECIGSRVVGALVTNISERTDVKDALRQGGAVVGLAEHPPVNEWPTFLTPKSPSLRCTANVLSRLLCVELKEPREGIQVACAHRPAYND